MNRRLWLATGAGVAAGLAGYAFLVEPRWLQVVRPTVHVRRMPPALEGLRIGLLSDLHLQAGSSPSLVRRAANRIMAERPDLIALTGDFAEDDAGLRMVVDALSHLRAPLGVFAVPGNHDHKAENGIEAWERAVAASPAIEDLTNRSVVLQHRGARVCVAGVDDLYEGRPELVLPPPEARDLTLLLAHTPDQAEQCRRRYDAVDLIVSGHTHGGQVRFPLVGAPVNSAEHEDLYEQGLRRRPWTQVYTSRGIGTSGLHVRFMARPEVTVITLTRRARTVWR